MSISRLSGQIVDVTNGEIFPGMIDFENGVIKSVARRDKAPEIFIAPGLIDAHIHIESSHLCPSRFAETVIPHGTTAVVTDPHEIANVFGMDGVKYMIRDSKGTPLRTFFTAPSCVPATQFETSGAVLTHSEVSEMLSWPEVVALGEMMNFPGAISGDEEVLLKIDAAKKFGKPVDGHAPMLSGEDLRRYASRGITTDHECTSQEEAEEKFSAGMAVQIRQGSASKNLSALAGFAKDHPFMLVSDDRSAHDLLRGHLDHTLREAVDLGIDPMSALQAVTVRPAMHYGLPGGWFEPGRAADFAIFDNLDDFEVTESWLAGIKVASEGMPLFDVAPTKLDLKLPCIRKSPADFEMKAEKENVNARAIGAIDGEIVTESSRVRLEVKDGTIEPNIELDALRLAVINRYMEAPVSNSFAVGFGLQEGAIASTVAHDSHNCIVVGVETEAMAEAANSSLECGGFSVSGAGRTSLLELPIAGLMTDRPASEVAMAIDVLLGHAGQIGCRLSSPFMTLSFMSLLVIPKLKLGDRGLFDVEEFRFVEPIEDDPVE